jgi:hypothetical protein
MKYFSPHQACLQQYLNLYQLVSLEMKQTLVHDTELAVREIERRNWDATDHINWEVWKDFVKDQGLHFKQTVTRRVDDDDPASPLLPLWKRLPESTEPVLLTLSVKLPQRKEGMILKIAYAVDQDGFVLGLSYNQMYQALMDEAHPTKEADGNGSSPQPDSSKKIPTNGGSEAPEDGKEADSYTLEFFVLPGETKSIRISAMYAENPVTVSPDKDLLDVLLYTSSYSSVADAAALPR